MNIRRDDHGIPYLWAGDAHELARLQGYNAATDRAWQIEVERWRCEGELARRIGRNGLAWDRFARRCRLADTARAAFERLDGETRSWVAAYVDGVNSGLSNGAAAAPEFAANDCAPGRWQPWTPLGVFAVQHALFGTFPDKLWHGHVEDTLGRAATELFATEPINSSGSNAWMLRADPETGAPVIAGDPHRMLELPGVYQQVGLACPEFDVIGLAFPGVPGVPHFGHTGGVAWAVTNAMADYQDLYREQIDRTHGRVRSREADGWADADVHTEQIAVRGEQPRAVEVITTARGPVIDFDRDTGEGISLRTPSRVECDFGFGALLPLLRARRVNDVAAALRDWVEPVNSVLAADDTGAARRMVAGLVPVRDSENHRGPVPGWQSRYRWRRGYARLADEAVPETAVAANDRRPDVAGLGGGFAPPHRAGRIRELLDAGARPETIHTDTRLDSPVLSALLRRLEPTDSACRVLLERLVDRDHRMDADSADAGAFAAWRAAFARRLREHPFLRELRTPARFDELFTPWTNPHARIGYALESVTAGLHRFGADVEPFALAALSDVAHGTPPGRWGRRHTVKPVRVSTDADTETAVAAIREHGPLPGDNDCVLATGSVPGISDACVRGPVARYVFDLGQRSRSRWVVPFGASGVPGSGHFDDQFPLWTSGRLVAVADTEPDRSREWQRPEYSHGSSEVLASSPS